MKLSSLRRTPDWIPYSSRFYSAKSSYLSNHKISSINLHSKIICILLKDEIKEIHRPYTHVKCEILDVEEVLGLRGDGHAPGQLTPAPP